MQKYRKKSLWLCLLVLANVFCVCGCAENLLYTLGFDTSDYSSEKVTGSHASDSDVGEMLSAMLYILAGDTTMPEFSSMSQAVSEYRDAVLSYMLENEYARYSGNSALIEQATQEYPEYQITQLIPATELETTMYRYFGGSAKIAHRDTGRFRYLSKVNAYVATAAFVPVVREVHISAIEETENTFRVYFSVQWNETMSPAYRAIVMKRKDGTYYFKELQMQPELQD